MEKVEEPRVPPASSLDRYLFLLCHSTFFQLLVLFPSLVLLCYLFGLFIVWSSLLFCAAFYLISEHNREREHFQRRYIHTLRTYMDHRNELPPFSTEDDVTVGVGGIGETKGISVWANMWWRTNALLTFKKKILPKIVESLNQKVQNNDYVQEFIEGPIVISSDGPKILGVKCKQSSFNSLYQDITWEYSGDTSLSLFVVIAGTNIPIEIKNIRFMGTIRLEMIFPHGTYLDGIMCKEQESFSMAISLIDEYLLDFEISASNINIINIPTLKSWIRKTIRKSVQQVALWPAQVPLFGPRDHMFVKKGEENTSMRPNLVKRHDSQAASGNIDSLSVIGITLFFPDGENHSPPEGYELIDKTCTGNYAANLNSGSSQRTAYLCLAKASIGSPITDICVTTGENIDNDTVPHGYRVIRVSYFGEEAHFYEPTKGDPSSYTYLCYEKSPCQAGYICDIRVMFDEEVPKVREMKKNKEAAHLDEFPVGYTMLKINSIPISESKKKNIYLCFKRVGGSLLPSLESSTAGFESRKTNSFFKALTSVKDIALNEVKDFKEARNEKERRRLSGMGVDGIVVERAKLLSHSPEIFQHFPIGTYSPKEEFFSMNDIQQKHALEILKIVPTLDEMRRRTAPSTMSDSTFWFIYFSFVNNKGNKR